MNKTFASTLRKTAFAAAIGLAAGFAPAAQASVGNVVQNSDFSNGVNSWNLTPGAAGDFAFNYYAPNSFSFGSVTPSTPDLLSQMLSTVAGQSYTISFNLDNIQPGASNGAAGSNGFSANFGGVNLLTENNAVAGSSDTYTFSEVATGSKTLLSFSGWNVPGWTTLTKLSVVGEIAPVPEPSEVALLLVGLGLIGVAATRKGRNMDRMA